MTLSLHHFPAFNILLRSWRFPSFPNLVCDVYFSSLGDVRRYFFTFNVWNVMIWSGFMYVHSFIISLAMFHILLFLPLKFLSVKYWRHWMVFNFYTFFIPFSVHWSFCLFRLYWQGGDRTTLYIYFQPVAVFSAPCLTPTFHGSLWFQFSKLNIFLLAKAYILVFCTLLKQFLLLVCFTHCSLK